MDLKINNLEKKLREQLDNKISIENENEKYRKEIEK
jgi:hypothetical protein